MSVNTAWEGANAAMEHDTVPFAPTAGVTQANPAGDASETKVMPAGIGSVNVKFAAGSGPPFVTVRV